MSQRKGDRFLKQNYLIMPVKSLACAIGRSNTYTRHRLKKLGLIIPAEIAKQRKASNQFKKGHVPQNKGRQMDDDFKLKVSRTFYRTGHLPHNTKYDGYTSIRRDKSGKAYKYIRTELGVMRPLHRVVWETEKGVIPAGVCIAFRNGDTLDCRIENLELLSRQENMKRNNIHNLPPELKETIIVLRTLKRKIKKYEKQRSDSVEKSHV